MVPRRKTRLRKSCNNRNSDTDVMIALQFGSVVRGRGGMGVACASGGGLWVGGGTECGGRRER